MPLQGMKGTHKRCISLSNLKVPLGFTGEVFYISCPLGA